MVYGHWKTVYNRHRRWWTDGIWIKALDGLRVGAGLDAGAGEWVVRVDAAVIRAHHHGAGARHAPPVDGGRDGVDTGGLTGGRIEWVWLFWRSLRRLWVGRRGGSGIGGLGVVLG